MPSSTVEAGPTGPGSVVAANHAQTSPADSPDPSTTRAAGRPRDETRDAASLEAALELVAEVGYDRMSMDALAARARTSKATIYRRWANKGECVAAAISCRSETPIVMADTGSLRGDLLALVTEMSRSMAEQDLDLMSGVFTAIRRDPDLANALRQEMFAHKVAATEHLFTRAAGRGDALVPHAHHLFLEVAPAVVIHRMMTLGLDVDEAFLTHLVDDILLPILALTPPYRKEQP